MAADRDLGTDVNKGVDRAIPPNFRIVFDHHERPNARVGTDPSARRDARLRVDAGRNSRRRIKKLDGAGERQVGVLRAQSGHRQFGELRGNDDRAGAGGSGFRGVAGVGDERQLPRARFLDAGNARDFGIAVAA